MSLSFCNPHLFRAHSSSYLSWMVSYGLSHVSPTCTWSPGCSAHIELSLKLILPSVAYYPLTNAGWPCSKRFLKPSLEHPAPAADTDTMQGTYDTLSPQWILSVILVELNGVKVSDWKSKVLPFLCSRDLDHSAGWCSFSCREAERLFEFKQCPNPGECPNQRYLLEGS